REHLAGDLADEDYELLRTRDERRLAEVDEALRASATAVLDDSLAAAERSVTRRARDPQGGAGSRWRVRWRRRWWFAALGVASVVAAAVLLVCDLSSPRLPGQDATGSITLNAAQKIERQLDQAQALAGQGRATQAMQLYGDVLTEDPRQPVALAEWGWLDWRAASAAKEQTVAAEGASALEEAVRIDRHLFVAQYYLGVVLYEEGAKASAISHFASFLADEPTAGWLREAAPEIRSAYRAEHEPVPAGVPRT
ncbi:MAG: tetratricopeptide repeat protein, partial [Acidimicrobiales bacterium]